MKKLVAQVSSEDSDLMSSHNWFNYAEGYVVANQKSYWCETRRKRIRKIIHLSRIVAARKYGRDLCEGEFVDHINGDKTDNRRENIRVVNKRQNGANKSVFGYGKSGHRNVFYRPSRNIYAVGICAKGMPRIYKEFKSLDEAVKFAHDKRREIWGEYAHYTPPRDNKSSASSAGMASSGFD